MSGCTFCNVKMTIPHSRLECPRRRSLFCYICSSHGHSIGTCPDKIACAVRAGKSTKGITNLEVRLQECEIDSFLKVHGLESQSKKTENYKLLRDIVNSMEPPRLLVFLPSE